VITVLDHRVLTLPPGVDLLPGNPAPSVSEAIANAAADRLRRAGLAASASVLSGDPKHVLVEAAREWEADCMFLGARGLTRVERFLLGSVSTSVAMHAPCSVEVVHPQAS
jgi:nucleotide-binding universal stress UspA family protein